MSKRFDSQFSARVGEGKNASCRTTLAAKDFVCSCVLSVLEANGIQSGVGRNDSLVCLRTCNTGMSAMAFSNSQNMSPKLLQSATTIRTYNGITMALIQNMERRTVKRCQKDFNSHRSTTAFYSWHTRSEDTTWVTPSILTPNDVAFWPQNVTQIRSIWTIPDQCPKKPFTRQPYGPTGESFSRARFSGVSKPPYLSARNIRMAPLSKISNTATTQRSIEWLPF